MNFFGGTMVATTMSYPQFLPPMVRAFMGRGELQDMEWFAIIPQKRTKLVVPDVPPAKTEKRNVRFEEFVAGKWIGYFKKGKRVCTWGKVAKTETRGGRIVWLSVSGHDPVRIKFSPDKLFEVGIANP